MARPKSNEQYRLISLKKITDASLRLFVKNGYRNTSVDQIATASRLTKGAVYYYFKNKEELLLHVLGEIERNWVDQTIAQLWQLNVSAASRLATYAHSHTVWVKDRPDDLMLLVMMSIEFANTKSDIKKRIEDIYAKIVDAFEKIIDEGKQRGEFSSQMPTRDIALIFMAAHDGNMLQWYRSGKDPEVGYILARAYRRVLLQTVLTHETLTDVPARSSGENGNAQLSPGL
jgi:AcrR family transcriptional regulator